MTRRTASAAICALSLGLVPSAATAADPAPAKPIVTWYPPTASGLVIGMARPMRGVTFRIRARNTTGTAALGLCALNPRINLIACLIHISTGTWDVTITPTKAGVSGPAKLTTYSFP